MKSVLIWCYLCSCYSLFNVCYEVCACELKSENISCVSVWNVSVVDCEMGIGLNLLMFVCIFQWCSKMLMFSLALSVVRFMKWMCDNLCDIVCIGNIVAV